MSLAAYEQEPAGLAQIQTSQDVAIARLGDWAKSASAAHSIAQTLVQTSFCPDSFRNKAGEATAAILAGLEVGLQPMAALRSFDIIQGQAAPRAITLRAIVQSHGHELEVVESTATRCRIRGRRRGSAEWQTVTWTIDRAKQAQLTNKPNWRKDSQAMLVARATGEMSRMIASDAILGIGYTVEEIADGTATAETTTPGPEAPTGTRRMGRKKPEPTPEPEQPEPADDPFDASDGDQADEPGETMLDPRSALAKRMFATIHDAGITEAKRLDFVSEVVGRDVGSSKELTEDEARQVIDACPAPQALPEGGDDQ